MPSRQPVLLYRMPPPDNVDVADMLAKDYQYRLGQLQSGEYGKPKDFSGWAHVLFNTQPRPVVLRSLEFSLPPSASKAASAEWQREGRMFFWHELGNPSAPLELPLASEGFAALSIGNFRSVHVEYSAIPDLPACGVQLTLEGTVRPLRPEPQGSWRFVARTAAFGELTVLSEIDPSKAAWKPKDAVYLLKRILGFAPDADWRYAQAGPLAVLQRRLREPLDDVEAMDIAIAGPVKVVQVNLRVGHQGGFGPGQVLEIGGFPPASTLPDGRSGIRVNLRDALQKRFAAEWAQNAKEPGKHRYELDEIVVFMRGDARALAAPKVLRSVALLGPDARGARNTVEQIRVQKLPSVVTQINTYRQRLAVDLATIAQLGRTELTQARLVLFPTPGSTACGVRVDRVRFVDAYDGAVPVFVSQAEEWIARLGGAAPSDLVSYGKSPYPRMLAFLPLSTLTSSDGGAQSAPEYALDARQSGQLVFRRLPKRAHESSYRMLAANGTPIETDNVHLVGPRGARMTSNGAMPKASQEGESLVLDGSAPSLTLSWPVDAEVDADTWFHFGTEDFKGDATIELEATDGRVTRRRIDVNQALHLTTAPLHLRSVRLIIEPSVTPYRIKLRDVAFYTIGEANPAEVAALPLPALATVKPQPLFTANEKMRLDVRPGHVAGILGNEPVRFTTRIDPALTWLRGILLTYRLPLTHGGGDCMLTLRLNWEKVSVERRLCLPKRQDNLFIPVAGWLGKDENRRDLGALRSIDWMLTTPVSGARGIDDGFELDFEARGTRLVSAVDQLRIAPLFTAGGKPAFAALTENPRIDSKAITRGLWLPLAPAALPALFAGPVEQLVGSPFMADEVVLEPRIALAPRRWKELTQPAPSPPAPSRVMRLLAELGILLAIVAAAWLSIRLAWWSCARRLATSALSQLVTQLAVPTWTTARAFVRHWSLRLNVLVAAAALGPGLWIAGAMDAPFRSAMMILAMLVLAWGAYAQLCDLVQKPWLGSGPSVRTRLLVVAVGLACAAWSFGRHGFSIESIWGFLPLLAGGYSLLPAFYGIGMPRIWRERVWLAFTAWLVATAFIYHRATIVDFGSEKNPLFALGAFVAVFALRSGLLALQRWVRTWSPFIGARVYQSGGSVFFTSAAVALVFACVAVSIQKDFLAEQFAIVAYYSLLFATVKEIMALRKRLRDASS